ncbi:MAG TPA: FISUMP domain-containing protein, partial [Bacteroidales bacterium]|nr:FISUMP domain-containing protein [Bacteroidales bacterium]
INSLTFQTHTNNINLLVETVCRLSNNGGNAIHFLSHNNLFPIGNNYTTKEISWQLDDPFGTALENDVIIKRIDLNHFEQFSGLYIRADSGFFGKSFLIKGLITEVISTVRDTENTIIEMDTSILVIDTLPVKVDTNLAVVIDNDGNSYKTVQIGEQIWMRENLRSLHDADGTPITDVQVYDNDENNAFTYGRLYTWNAVMNGSPSSLSIPSGVQGICPDGWRLPSDNEWYTLIKYLGGPADAGARMKEAGTVHWERPNEGAENTSYLTVRPAGSMQSGNFYSLGTVAAFWSTAECYQIYARYVFLNNLSTRAVIYNDGNRSACLSVRCIKNEGSISSIVNMKDNDYKDFYPNPAERILYVAGFVNQATIFIYDLNGRMIHSSQIYGNAFNIQHLTTGIYIIKVVTDDNVQTGKFIKQ